MILRCVIDGLLLPAEMGDHHTPLIAYDGDESFAVEVIEAHYYELVEAAADELLHLEKHQYRLLKRADDFHLVQCAHQVNDFLTERECVGLRF